jgi:hypothetical protein
MRHAAGGAHGGNRVLGLGIMKGPYSLPEEAGGVEGL